MICDDQSDYRKVSVEHHCAVRTSLECTGVPIRVYIVAVYTIHKIESNLSF